MFYLILNPHWDLVFRKTIQGEATPEAGLQTMTPTAQ